MFGHDKRQTCVCHDKTRLLSRQKDVCRDKTFAATNICRDDTFLSRHNFCRDKNDTCIILSPQNTSLSRQTRVSRQIYVVTKDVFVATKTILVAAPANDSPECSKQRKARWSRWWERHFLNDPGQELLQFCRSIKSNNVFLSVVTADHGLMPER